MKLASMRYKSFVWPHNPRVYSIEFERAMALNKIPFGRYVLQNLGLTRRVMRGEGEFQGADAYEQFKKLATVFYEETPGTLVHPLWDTTTAWLVELRLEQEPRPDYVKYSFTFWEEGLKVTIKMLRRQCFLEICICPYGRCYPGFLRWFLLGYVFLP